MAMNNDHFHTHGPDELAMLRAECDKWHKAYDRVWEERMRFADRALELEKENAALKEERRWRKCSEEMPKSDIEQYLVYDTKTKEYGKSFCSQSLKNFQFPVTHWMPLPKAPEDK